MADPSPCRLFDRLPEELLQAVLALLDRKSLKCLNLASRRAYEKASPHIWREVELADCRLPHSENHHDDTPLIKKLLILSTRPRIASLVQTVTHRCHLPPPAIFEELPQVSFTGQTLSSDPRTVCLVRLAVRNLRNVHTLQIIFGHPRLTEALLRCFFDRDREREVGVRRLWLENCRIIEGVELHLDRQKHRLPLNLDFCGLQSLRLRRLPMHPLDAPMEHAFRDLVYNREGDPRPLRDGRGRQHHALMSRRGKELAAAYSYLFDRSSGSHTADQDPIHELLMRTNQVDDETYDALAKDMDLPAEIVEATIPSHAVRAHAMFQEYWAADWPHQLPQGNETLFAELFRYSPPSAADCALSLLQNCSSTLTSLNLDWVLIRSWPRPESSLDLDEAQRQLLIMDLFNLRCPNLRAFQVRNAVVHETLLPAGVYLFDRVYPPGNSGAPGALSLPHQTEWKALEFMEAHPKLQCLAWPMDRFFSTEPDPSAAVRVRNILDTLGRTLVDLRVDTQYSVVGEAKSEERETLDVDARTRRRRFVAEFATEMKRVESVKIEGGMPSDERREVLRALHACRVEKIVLIGVSCPLGNAWGADGRDRGEPVELEEERAFLEEEDSAVWALGCRAPVAPAWNSTYSPSYGWAGCAPMVHTIAAHHGASVREVKLCGYKGSPVLLSPTAITTPLLAGLKHLDKLQSLTLSVFLSTLFEGARRDNEILDYWLAGRDASSTSLVPIRDEEPEEGTWERELRTKYAPDALAWRVTSLIGPYLSEEAKRRSGGVQVRASFCLGDWGGIFHVDVRIGKGSLNSDVCLGFEGPRDELQAARRQEKLQDRRWF